MIIHVIARADTIDTRAGDGPTHTPPPTAPDVEVEPDTAEAEPQPDTDTCPAEPAAPPRDLAAQRRALAGASPPLLPRPWSTYTLAELTAALHTGEYPAAPPAVILGGPVLPAPITAQVAMHATITALIHPGQAPPEPGYRPSKKLADFVRSRDLTCRAAGCTKSATLADIDHTIPWPYGPTCASNLKCLCREHHLLKTFWPGWSERQLPDGTVIWTDPDGHSATTHPGSRLLFPELCSPTASFTVTGTPPPKHTAGLTMPKRKTTRKQDRQRHIDAQRKCNAA